MPYRVEFHASAAVQIPGLPGTVFEALTAVLVAVSRDPWGQSEPEGLSEAPEWRYALFGPGDYGMVFFRIDDHSQTVHVYRITWAG